MQPQETGESFIDVCRRGRSGSPWPAPHLALAALVALAACVGPNDPNRDPEVLRAFATLQPVADVILAQHARTGRYPENLETLFFEHEWPGFQIQRGHGQPVRADYNEWVIVSPVQEPETRLTVAYRSSSQDARLTLLDYGNKLACSWYSYSLDARWSCLSNP